LLARPLRAPTIPCARTGGGFAERIAVAPRPRWLGTLQGRVQGLAVLPSSNNTLRVLLWATIPCARTGGSFCWANSGVPAPVGLELCKAGFGGSPCYLGNKQHAQRFACRIGRPRWLGTLQGRVRGLAVLLSSNNTLNVSRAGSGTPLSCIFVKPITLFFSCYRVVCGVREVLWLNGELRSRFFTPTFYPLDKKRQICYKRKSMRKCYVIVKKYEFSAILASIL
jgi:hypothetical protein